LRPHLHVSLQSGSDAVLRRMRRPYRVETARRAVLAAAAARPGCGIGADLIVGFPAETDVEFAETVALVEELPLTYLHVFPFSPRPGTDAADLPGQVEPALAARRAAALRRIATRHRRRFEASLIGARREATAETGTAPDGWRPATAENYAAVLVPSEIPAGAMIRLTVAAGTGGRLQGADVEILDRPASLAPPAGGDGALVAPIPESEA
jgi:threonylcarbamoyladenosine tRNA methylthiotransferase MtaB